MHLDPSASPPAQPEKVRKTILKEGHEFLKQGQNTVHGNSVLMNDSRGQAVKEKNLSVPAENPPGRDRIASNLPLESDHRWKHLLATQVLDKPDIQRFSV